MPEGHAAEQFAPYIYDDGLRQLEEGVQIRTGNWHTHDSISVTVV